MSETQRWWLRCTLCEKHDWYVRRSQKCKGCGEKGQLTANTVESHYEVKR